MATKVKWFKVFDYGPEFKPGLVGRLQTSVPSYKRVALIEVMVPGTNNLHDLPDPKENAAFRPRIGGFDLGQVGKNPIWLVLGRRLFRVVNYHLTHC